MISIRPIPLLSFILMVGTAHAGGVGLRMLETREPTTGTVVPFAMVYPATDAKADAVTQMGPYALQAQKDAEIADGAHPLVLLSHGNGGSMFGHHDLAEALARHGYIVAMPEHAGDSYRDQSGFATDRVLLGRAWQASAVISAVLADAQLKAHVDAKRIGAAGFSAGGYTTLLLLGARPDFSRFQSFCEKYPKTPDICDRPPPKQQRTIANPPPTADPRVRAGFSMAPLSLILDKKGLSRILRQDAEVTALPPCGPLPWVESSTLSCRAGAVWPGVRGLRGGPWPMRREVDLAPGRVRRGLGSG